MSTSCASSADVLNVGAGSPLVPSNVGVERNVTIAAGAVWRIGDNATTLLQVGKNDIDKFLMISNDHVIMLFQYLFV